MTTDPDLARHWDDAYSQGDESRSWFQLEPRLSLRMFDDAGISEHDSVLDVGGGASTLVDALLRRGFDDVTVVDLSATGMRLAQHRIGTGAQQVQWIVADVLTWQPPRRFQVWHDRVVFHFLTTDRARERYLRLMKAATLPQAAAVFGCFAVDGPQQCSGLPTSRYDARDLAAVLGTEWTLITEAREEHVTPGGAVQPLTWATFRRRA